MSKPIQKPLYNQSLIVDLYELTMSAGYFTNDFNEPATFELFIRKMPPNRSFLVAAGLKQVTEYLLNLKFTEEEVQYLKQLPPFKHVKSEFWDYLEAFKFTGEVWAIPEGQIVFSGEPLLRVTAPMIEAQVIETFVLSMINFQTLVASKAARVTQAATMDGKDRTVIEFGSRRAHGAEASVLAARASFIGGCIGSSNVMAGMRYQFPVFGTAAHSWTMAFPSEIESFRAYYSVFPESSILLIDTYDIKQGARNATKVAKDIKGVRIDSGDLLKHSREVRQILDEAGMQDVMIVVSGDLNEDKIIQLVQAGAPIDSFGVGTQLATSADVPYLGGIYKLVQQEIGGETRYRAKFSEDKATYPGKKQVYRLLNTDGTFEQDIIGLERDELSGHHAPLLVPILKQGKLVYEFPEIDETRTFFFENIKKLNPKHKRFENPQPFSVTYSDNLQKLFNDLKDMETRYS